VGLPGGANTCPTSRHPWPLGGDNEETQSPWPVDRALRPKNYPKSFLIPYDINLMPFRLCRLCSPSSSCRVRLLRGWRVPDGPDAKAFLAPLRSRVAISYPPRSVEPALRPPQRRSRLRGPYTSCPLPGCVYLSRSCGQLNVARLLIVGQPDPALALQGV
jgi:hypothetical protein